MSDRTDAELIGDIQEAIRRVEAYTKAMNYEQFLSLRSLGISPWLTGGVCELVRSWLTVSHFDIGAWLSLQLSPLLGEGAPAATFGKAKRAGGRAPGSGIRGHGSRGSMFSIGYDDRKSASPTIV